MYTAASVPPPLLPHTNNGNYPSNVIRLDFMYALRNVSRWGLKTKLDRQISVKKRKNKSKISYM